MRRRGSRAVVRNSPPPRDKLAAQNVRMLTSGGQARSALSACPFLVGVAVGRYSESSTRARGGRLARNSCMPRDTAPAVTVTVVDDEPLVAEMLVRAAACWNYRCQTALSVGAALQLFEKNPTPILVTDLHMPGTSGT